MQLTNADQTSLSPPSFFLAWVHRRVGVGLGAWGMGVGGHVSVDGVRAARVLCAFCVFSMFMSFFQVFKFGKV